jgi:hypothetical protein
MKKIKEIYPMALNPIVPQLNSIKPPMSPAAPVANRPAAIAPAPSAQNLTPAGSPQALAKTPQGLFGPAENKFAGPLAGLPPEELKSLAVEGKLTLKGDA